MGRPGLLVRAHTRTSGVTLVETLIACALLVLVVGATLTLFVESLVYYSALDDANTLTQGGQIAMNRLCTELAESHAGSIQWNASPPGVVFASPKGADGRFHYDPSTNALLWQGYVCYYVGQVQGVRSLVRKELYFSSIPMALPTSPPSVPSTYNTAYFQAASLPVWVCPNVTSLSGSLNGAVELLTLQMTTQPSSSRANSMTVFTSVYPRN